MNDTLNLDRNDNKWLGFILIVNVDSFEGFIFFKYWFDDMILKLETFTIVKDNICAI